MTRQTEPLQSGWATVIVNANGRPGPRLQDIDLFISLELFGSFI